MKKYEDNDNELKKISDQIVQLDEEDVYPIQLKPRDSCPRWFREDWAPTVGEFIQNIQQQVVIKYKSKLQKR